MLHEDQCFLRLLFRTACLAETIETITAELRSRQILCSASGLRDLKDCSQRVILSIQHETSLKFPCSSMRGGLLAFRLV